MEMKCLGQYTRRETLGYSSESWLAGWEGSLVVANNEVFIKTSVKPLFSRSVKLRSLVFMLSTTYGQGRN